MVKLFNLLLLLPALCFITRAQTSEVATAKQVNGTYRLRANEFRVLALGRNKLRVQFEGAYEYKSPAGPTANVGSASGEATVKGNVAEFIPPDTESCKITLTFWPGKLVVKQEGSDADCGFGHNVYAGGTYVKKSGAKPRFDETKLAH